METLNIRTAFQKKILEITPVTLDTAYENVEFTPTQGKAYQRLQQVPFTPENPSYGDNYFREVGEFQVFLCYPKGEGYKDLYEQASLIRDTFFRGFSMTEGGTIVTIRTTPAIDSAVQFDDRYCIPVRIEYFASILKN